MNFDLSEEQELYKATTERFVASVDVEARRKIRAIDGAYDGQRWTELAALGLLSLAAGEAHGGLGGSMIDLAVIAESLGRGNAADPWLENGVLPVKLLTAAQNKVDLGPYLDGSRIAAFAFAEPGRRYSLQPKVAKASKSAKGYVLNGEKTFVLGAAIADDIIVTANLDGETAFFLLPVDAQGVQIRPYRVADGSMAGELFLRNVELQEKAHLPLGHDDFLHIVSDMHLLASAEMVGLCQLLLDDTLDYVKQREQFGVPIGSFQVIQHGLADAYAALEQARSMMLRGLLMSHADNPAKAQASAAGVKAFASQQGQFIAGRAVQYHGGMGVTDELAIGHAVKRLLLLDSLFGDAAHNLEMYARAA